MRRASALLIGNELLSGKIADTNLLILARCLRGLGIALRRVVMILDDPDVIASDVKSLAATHDLVFTSGGIGPTHDDVTVEGVARAFGVTVIRDHEMERRIRSHYGATCTESHLLHARVPEGARLVSTPDMPWPTVVMRNVWLLPGVPEVFRMKMRHVETLLGGDAPFVSFAVFTTLDESDLKPLLDGVVATYGDVDIGSYPRWHDPEYQTKLTFDGIDEARARAARDAFAACLPPATVVRIV
jgi:molybdenum cofactor synthesis domain-containing protein